MECDPLLTGLFYLPTVGGHFLGALDTDEMDVAGADAAGSSGYIDGNVSPADDHNLVAKLGRVSQAGIAEKVYGVEDPIQILPRNGHDEALVHSHSDQNHVVVALQRFEGDIPSYLHAEFELDADLLQKGVLAIDDRPRKAVFGNADPHHAPDHAETVEDGDPVALAPQVEGRLGAGRPRTDDGDALGFLRCHGQVPEFLVITTVRHEPLEGGHRQRMIHFASLALVLAGMGANSPQRGG